MGERNGDVGVYREGDVWPRWGSSLFFSCHVLLASWRYPLSLFLLNGGWGKRRWTIPSRRWRVAAHFSRLLSRYLIQDDDAAALPAIRLLQIEVR